MKVLFDTTVLIAAMVETHASHQVALTWLLSIKNGEHSGLVAAHSLAEFYAVSTALPVSPRITPFIAKKLIQENIVGLFEIISLSGNDYIDVVNQMANTGISGGTIYDAIIFHAANKANAEKILTLNDKHFRRIYPALTDKIVAP